MSEQQDRLHDTELMEQIDIGGSAMGEEPFFPNLTLGSAWGESITKKRADELEAQWRNGNLSRPFAGGMLTGADIFFMAARVLSGTGPRTGFHFQPDPRMEERNLAAAVSQLLAARLDSGGLAELDLSALHLQQADISGAHLEGSVLNRARLQGADLTGAHLEDAHLLGADLRRANLTGAYLDRAYIVAAQLEGAILYEARLGGANLSGARMQGADLRLTFFDAETRLNDIILSDESLGSVRLADIRWGGVNLSVVNWGSLPELADDREARVWAPLIAKGTAKPKPTKAQRTEAMKELRLGHLREYQAAVRANRQLATVLREQGLNDDADRFVYRAQVLQRQVLRRQGRALSALGSWFLDRIAGYGYRPMRSFITYVLVVGAFALTYYLLGNNVNPPLDPLSALVFSITSFHGRGFAPGENVLLNNPVTVIAAGEAIIGLLIEITFIATFTQRFFAR